MKKQKYRNVSPSTVLLVRQILIGFLIAAFFGMLLTSVWYGTRVDAFTINTVTIRGGETIPHGEIEAIVRKELDGSYMKFVPRAFAPLYPHQDIERSIREIKRIKNLQLVRVSGTELSVEFEEYVPHALWCQHSDSEGCFFLDENGYSFAAAPSLTGGSFLRFVAIAKDPVENAQAFDVEHYKKVHELVEKFAESKWFVSKVELDAVGDAFFTLVQGGEFKVSLKQSTQETMDNMLTVLNSEKFSHIAPGNFEYVDLRFGSKVFVNEVTITASSSYASTTPPAFASEPAEIPPAALPQETPVETAPTPAPDAVEIHFN
jgi:cell division septal protein FtsQ